MRNPDVIRNTEQKPPSKHGRPLRTYYRNGYSYQPLGVEHGKEVKRVRRARRGKGPKNHRGN